VPVLGGLHHRYARICFRKGQPAKAGKKVAFRAAKDLKMAA